MHCDIISSSTTMFRRIAELVGGVSAAAAPSTSQPAMIDPEGEHEAYRGADPKRRSLPGDVNEESFTYMPLNYTNPMPAVESARFILDVEAAIARGEGPAGAEESRVARFQKVAPVLCKVRNGRFLDISDQPRLEREGFQLCPHGLDRGTFGDDHTAFLSNEFVKTHYYPAIASFITDLTKGDLCIGIHHVVRTADAAIRAEAQSKGNRAENPAPAIHTDFSAAHALATYQHLVAAGAVQKHLDSCGYSSKTPSDVKRVQFINCWRSIASEEVPILRDHLAMCDQRSVVVPDDIVTIPKYDGGKWRDGMRLNAEFAHHRPHRWFYFPLMRRSEVLVFTQYDSLTEVVGSNARPRMCFHTAASGNSTVPDHYQRISLEYRAVVLYFSGEGRGLPLAFAPSNNPSGPRAILNHLFANHNVNPGEIFTREEKEQIAAAGNRIIAAVAHCDNWDSKGKTFLMDNVGMGPGYNHDRVRATVNMIVDVSYNMGTLGLPPNSRRPVVNGVKQYILSSHVDAFVAKARVGLAKTLPPRAVVPTSHPTYEAAVAQLQAMGFADVSKNRGALVRTSGNVQAAIELLL